MDSDTNGVTRATINTKIEAMEETCRENKEQLDQLTEQFNRRFEQQDRMILELRRDLNAKFNRILEFLENRSSEVALSQIPPPPPLFDSLSETEISALRISPLLTFSPYPQPSPFQNLPTIIPHLPPSLTYNNLHQPTWKHHHGTNISSTLVRNTPPPLTQIRSMYVFIEKEDGRPGEFQFRACPRQYRRAAANVPKTLHLHHPCLAVREQGLGRHNKIKPEEQRRFRAWLRRRRVFLPSIAHSGDLMAEETVSFVYMADNDDLLGNLLQVSDEEDPSMVEVESILGSSKEKYFGYFVKIGVCYIQMDKRGVQGCNGLRHGSTVCDVVGRLKLAFSSMAVAIRSSEQASGSHARAYGNGTPHLFKAIQVLDPSPRLVHSQKNGLVQAHFLVWALKRCYEILKLF